jgi:hypothetical protein
MKKKLFIAAALYHKKIEKDNKTEYETTVIFSGKEFLAQDDKIVAMQVVRSLPEEYGNKLEDVEILVRPF